ncbi:MAG: epoxyqueuosine reductase QueH [Dehalococcoidia bacterium]
MATLLIHTCCAPCATYTVEHWRKQRLEVASLWYNPNIHPYQEHQRRLETLEFFARAMELSLIKEQGYQMIEYLRGVVGREAERCTECFRLRLSRTAQKARELGMDAFTTTLLISPYQKHDLLREVGERVAREQKIKFLYEDLRPGYPQSREMSRELGLYRQQYCGCLYSEWERFGRVSIVGDLGLEPSMTPDPQKERG